MSGVVYNGGSATGQIRKKAKNIKAKGLQGKLNKSKKSLKCPGSVEKASE